MLVFPGGYYDAYRPTFSQNVVDFNGRKGYVRVAMEAGVPIVSAVSIGGRWGSSGYAPRFCRWGSASRSA